MMTMRCPGAHLAATRARSRSPETTRSRGASRERTGTSMRDATGQTTAYGPLGTDTGTPIAQYGSHSFRYRHIGSRLAVHEVDRRRCDQVPGYAFAGRGALNGPDGDTPRRLVDSLENAYGHRHEGHQTSQSGRRCTPLAAMVGVGAVGLASDQDRRPDC